MANKRSAKIDGATSENGQVFFHWSFPEFPRYERGRRWYAGMAVVVGLLLLYSVVSANFLFGLLVVIAALMLVLFQRINRMVDVEITEDGVAVNGQLREYKSLRNFYIIYEPPTVKTLYFESKNIFVPRIPLALEDQNPLKIREVLKRYLEEDLEKENEPMSDSLSRRLKL